jgi:metal-responsive CopG/Arc/MetJ family transcriptional regulator
MATENIMTLRVPATLAEAIDIYWHRERLPSRSAAIRALLDEALEQKLAERPAKKARR